MPAKKYHVALTDEERASLEQAEPNRPRAQGPSPQGPRRRPSKHEDDDMEIEKP